MLAFAPLGTALAQAGDTSSDDTTVAPAAPADDDNSDVAAPAPAAAAPSTAPAPAASTAPAAPAAAAPAAPAAAAPAAAAASSGSAAVSEASMRQLEQVTVTGTAIPRTDAETSLPVTTYNTDELRNEGVTTVSQIVDQVVSNDSSAGPGSGYGLGINGGASFASLRGLGSNATLILLNGRRLANNSFNGGATDLESIPLSAIDRVEVLKSGASAIYGSDAIAGVINFITKSQFDGGDFRAQYNVPTRDGGGTTKTLDGTFGYGSLRKDRFNVMGSFTYRRSDAVTASDRSGITDPLQPRFGIDATSILPYPANFYQDNPLADQDGQPARFTGNPNYGAGCPGRFSLVNPDPDTRNCLYDPNGFYQIKQDNDYASFYGQGTYLLTDNHQVHASFLYTHNEVNSQIGPYGTIGEMTPDSPYYPADAVAASGGNPNDNILAYYRNTITGPRSTHNTNQSMRGIIELKGHFGKLHYVTGLNYGQQTTTLDYTGGYLNSVAIDQEALGPTSDDDLGDDTFSQAINDGRINPFNPRYSANASNFFNDLVVTGQAEKDRIHQYAWDGKLNRELGDWFGAGQLGLAIGGNVRYKKLQVYSNNSLQNQIAGGGLSGQGLDEDRTIESVYGDINIPILDSLSIEAAGRYDHYSDFGSTANPKVSLRWQPVDQLVVRANYGTGFHAPNLYDLYTADSITFSANGLDDPALCPDGENAVSGYATRDVCDTQFERHYGGNPDLDPRESEQYGFGFVVQPFKVLSASLDYYNIETSGDASLLPVEQVFGDTDKYADNIVRNQDGPNEGQIDYIQTDYANLGKTHTEGLDSELNLNVPTHAYGNFTLQFKGTYVLNYDFQSAPGEPFLSNEGEYVIASPVIQWNHRILLGWSYENFNAEFINHYTAGYDDQDTSTHKSVNPYITYDASVGYRFDNGIHVQLGSRNIFDQDPPVSNETTIGVPGYDPRYASALGRTVFASLGYKFD